MHRPSSARKTVLVANASLSSGLDWSECSNVVLIETAVRYEMVAKESSVQGWHIQPGGCWRQQTYSRRDVWGCNRRCKRRLPSPAIDDREPQRCRAGHVRSETIGKYMKNSDMLLRRAFVQKLASGLLTAQALSGNSRTGHSITLTKWWNGRHATLRTSCHEWHGSSTLPLVTALCRRAHCPLDTTQVSQCSAGPHKPGLSGATPEPAT